MGTVETVQTMQTQSELMVPTSTSSAMEAPLFPTGVVYAPHVEHLGNTLQVPQATSSPGSNMPGAGQQGAAMPVYEGPQSSSGNADTTSDFQQAPGSGYGDSPAPAASAYQNEPMQAPTTLATSPYPATLSGGTAVSPAIMQGIGETSCVAPVATGTTLSPSAFMSIMAAIFPLGGYTSPVSSVAPGVPVSSPAAAPASAVSTTQSAHEQSVQMGGMTLAPGPTSTSWTPDGGNSLAATGTSTFQPELANNGAGVVSVRYFMLVTGVVMALYVI